MQQSTQRLPQTKTANPFTPTKHWCQLRLDNYSTIYIRDINLYSHELIYKVLSIDGILLEDEQLSSFDIVGEEVQLKTTSIPWVYFTKIIDVLTDEK